ncbi:transposase [Baekduia sp. Peel2402]|uniref:transposase n=1 Tax=Baekduia sp. Peel2402 TaxID=3458296 RepID=UPI00403E9B53
MEFPYAFKRPLHAARDAGEKAHSIRTGDLWQSVVVPACAEWDRERDYRPDGKRKPGPRRKYTCEEGEVIELLRRLLGVTSYTAVIDWLSSDRGRIACDLLGFDHERQAPRRGDPRRFRQAGVPSASTLSDLRKDIGEERRLVLWQQFEGALRERYAAQTGREGRVLHLDGVNIRTKGEAPKYHRDTGALLNPESVSVFDGGYQPVYAAGKKGGHGFNMVLLTDDLGVPLAYEIGPMQASESQTAVRVLNTFNDRVRPHLPTEEVRVVSADAAFSAPTVRMAARRAGIVENIHKVSHHKKDESFKNASAADKRYWPIQGYDNWRANGHRELLCACGQGTSERVAWIDRHGHARTRSKGRCKTCGSITLLSGDWRAAQNPARWVRTLPGEPPERADWQLGNPLTFNDRMAARYGRKRWVRGEGVHGILTTHYKLNANRRQYRSKRQVELEASIVFSCILALALQQREHEQAQASAQPPTSITPIALAVAA